MNLIYRTKQLLLLAGDLVCLTASFWLSLTLRAWRLPTWLEIERNLVPFAIVFVIWSIVNYINGLYDLDRNRRDLAFYRRIAETAGFSFVFGMAFTAAADELVLADFEGWANNLGLKIGVFLNL